MARRSTPPAPGVPIREISELKQLLAGQIEEGQKLRARPLASESALDAAKRDFEIWVDSTRELLRQSFSTVSVDQEFAEATTEWATAITDDLRYYIGQLQRRIDRGITKLQGIHDRLKFATATTPPSASRSSDTTSEGLHLVLRTLHGFHRGVLQMRQRRNGRPTLDVKDEYDAQDFLHALLRVDFADVRVEEPTPTYGKGPSRIDFLLPAQSLAVETKHVRPTLMDNEVRDELILDIARYRKHPTCKTLVCFVYDPGHLLSNPGGLVADLERESTAALRVVVVVEPKR